MTEIPDPQPIQAAPAPAGPGLQAATPPQTPTPPHVPTPPHAAPTPPPPETGLPPAAVAGYPHPFVAAPRPPRALWINPERRLHVAAAAVVIGLICGGAGVGIGWAASDGGGRHGVFPIGPGAAYGRHLRPGPYGFRPLKPNAPATAPTPVTPAPSASATH